MSKMKNVWAVSGSIGAESTVLAAARALGEHVVLVDAAAQARAVGDSVVNLAKGVCAAVKAAAPQLVIVDNSRNGRLLSGLIAAAVKANVITDPNELSAGDGVTGRRMVFGGAALKTERALSPTAVVCIGSGLYEEDGQSADETVALDADGSVRFIEKKEKAAGCTVDLTKAKRVVCVGRGIRDEETLKRIERLSQKLGFDVGCTRPVAEEMQLLPRELYIGVSGLILKPELYLGFGVSGQVQHTVGISSANTVFAVNKDPKAPIFNQCDYGLVCDLETALPALEEVFS